ncbi:uncharacterized protein LOC133422035 isoform X6 [Cololabis saira]|uniref:uncharacterized protein LOC133422035 isoform X6 n=1 Tax=Cololabis saira TaxID=129043 RepID=UPI002AD42FD2|nr:uncharacterized protein LOC133422035 isoform X6 [Cololabis saira]
MLLRALLQTSLILCLAQQTLQGGTKPQNVNYARMLPGKGPGIGVKPGGPLGALGSRYGTKAMKTGIGRYPVAHHGVGGYRSLGLGGKAALKQGGYVNQGPYGANLGAGVGLGHGLPNGLGLGHAGKRGYGNGHGTLPGYGAFPGMTYPGVRQGHNGGGGNYLGANMGNGGYGPGLGQGLGQGPYLGGAAGKLGGAAGLGQGGYPHGVGGKTNGYHDGAAGFHGVAAGNGFGYGNGYGDGLGADLGYPAELADVAENKAGKSKALGNGNGAYNGHPQGGYGALGAGLDPAGGKYGGAAGQGPYGNAPMIPAGLEGDVGYPFGSQPLSLVAEGAKTASKYGAAAGYGGHQPGYGAQQLGVAHDGLGEHNGKYGMNGGHGNGYKG